MNELKQRRYILFLLFLVSMFSYIDRTIISILQVPIKHDLDLSDAQLGALTGLSFALFYATLSLPIARWADRSVRTRIVAGSLAIWSSMTALTGLATGFASLVFFRIGVAVGEAGSIPATHSIIADIYPPKVRATAIAILGLSLPLGMMVGYASAGALAEAVGWRAAFAIIGIVGVLLAPLIVFTMREPIRGRLDPVQVADAPIPSTFQALQLLWHLKTYRYLIAGASLHAYTYYSIINWNAPFYVRVHGLSLGEASFYLALLNGIGGGIGMYLGGRLSDSLGSGDTRWRTRVLTIAGIIFVPMGLAQYLVESVYLSIAFGAVASTLMPFYYGPVVAVPQLLVPPRMRAFTSAVTLLSVNLIGLGLGPYITGLISDLLINYYGQVETSLRIALSTSLLFALAAAWLFWHASKFLPQEQLVADARESPESPANAAEFPHVAAAVSTA